MVKKFKKKKNEHFSESEKLFFKHEHLCFADICANIIYILHIKTEETGHIREPEVAFGEREKYIDSSRSMTKDLWPY